MPAFDLKLCPLPPQVAEVCASVAAPPRLVAHLTLVRDVAVKLTAEISDRFPATIFDAGEVLFGAATHDIGKALHPAELVDAGNLHEIDGAALLEQLGINARMARFARTHAAWSSDDTLNLEDLLVALADTCWKGKRSSELEALIARRIAQGAGIEEWEVFVTLDIVSSLAADADKRLAWQAEFRAE